MIKKISYIFIGFVTLTMSSCSDWLGLTPEDGVIRQEYWQTKEHVKAAVNGCYCSLINGPVQKMFLWGELRADMLENGLSPLDLYSQVLDGEISSSSSIVSWASLYSVINNCNTVLKFAPAVRAIDGTFTDKQLKAYEAEALTIRAMMYFQLVRSFRDVPLVLTASVSDDQDYSIPKTSGAIILDTLVNDLKIAAENAPISYSTTQENKNRVTAYTVKTLLADIYLWQEKYSLCANLCKEIISSGKYSLIPVSKKLVYVSDGSGVVLDSVTIANDADAEKMFSQSYVDGNSIESIFELPFTTQLTNPFYSLLSPTTNYLRPKSDIVDGIIFPTTQYAGEARSAADIRGSGCSFRNSLIWKYVGVSRTGAVRTATQYTTPWIMYKYSDILLMYAEALNQQGLAIHDESAQTYYSKAIAAMEEVRVARNAVNTFDYRFVPLEVDGKALEKAILDERAREFAYEGKRWYDVLRYAKRNDYADNNLHYLTDLAVSSAPPEKQDILIQKYKDKNHDSHYLPIYIKELEANKQLKQNDFYLK